MSSRREFLIKTGLASSLAFVGLSSISFKSLKKPSKVAKGPIVVSTWNFGIPANEAAMKVLAHSELVQLAYSDFDKLVQPKVVALN